LFFTEGAALDKRDAVIMGARRSDGFPIHNELLARFPQM
jgi:hypothetical protein